MTRLEVAWQQRLDMRNQAKLLLRESAAILNNASRVNGVASMGLYEHRGDEALHKATDVCAVHSKMIMDASTTQINAYKLLEDADRLWESAAQDSSHSIYWVSNKICVLTHCVDQRETSFNDPD